RLRAFTKFYSHRAAAARKPCQASAILFHFLVGTDQASAVALRTRQIILPRASFRLLNFETWHEHSAYHDVAVPLPSSRVFMHGDHQMHLRDVKLLRSLVAVCLALAITASAWGQESQPADQRSSAPLPQTPEPAPQTKSLQAPFQFSDYSKPRGYFPNPFAPYLPRHVPPPSLANTPRIEQLMQEGKVLLSLNDAIALALENNLDIAIARFNLPIADTDILLANAGQSTRGVNTGVVQGTPGGGVGGIGGATTTGSQGGGAGGTTAGAGGAGTGTSGLVTSTLGVGAPIPSFDPFL